MGNLKTMLNPKTVAFIGADDREGSMERSILDNLLSSGERRILAVNPDRPRVLDMDCYPSISAIQACVDLAVIATPYESVPGIAEECARKGVEGIIILSQAPRLLPERKRELEGQIWDIRRRYGMRIIGPASNGIILPNVGLVASPFKTNPALGSTAFISQSRTIGNAMLYWGVTNRIGFSMFASLGSMVDVDFADLIDFLQDDYFTKSIMLYVEHLTNTKRFLSASRCFARDKPIVILKPGRYPRSAEVLTSHVGLEVGNDAVYDAAFRRVGIVRAKEAEGFFDAAKVLISRSLPRGPRLAVITNSGGIGIIVCDTLVEQRGELALLSEKSTEQLGPLMPQTWGGRNPVDLLEDAAVDKYVEAVNVCLKDNEVDSVLVVYAPTPQCDPGELAARMVELVPRTAKPLIAVWMGGRYSSEGARILREANVPVYETPENAVRAYMHMFNYRKGIEALSETPEEVPENETRLIHHMRAVIRNALRERKELLSEEEAADFLKNYGIPSFKKPFPEGNGTADRALDEWALKSMRDIDFGTVILLISMTGTRRNSTGFAVGLPPLNQVLARHLMEEADFRTDDGPLTRCMEEILIGFSNLVVDFPEIEEIEIESVVTDSGMIYAKNTTIRIDRAFQKGVAHYPHLVIMPYPSRYIMPWRIRDGRDVLLRPLRAEDVPLVNEMLSTLSEETLRVRFFVVIEINHKMLMQFCNIDYDREIAIIAELKEGDKKKIIAGGRLIAESDSGNGQFAVLVHDDFQRQGLGEKLLDTMIGIAHDKGLQEIYGIVLTENDKMLRLSKSMGFKTVKLPDGITRVSLGLD
jgi:acetyltransferase